MRHGSPEVLRELALKHLPLDVAERWFSLLRPALRLRATADTDAAGAAVGRLGGLPELPAETEWPVWEGHGPLSFIAAIDCGALPDEAALDIVLPREGTLAFFYFDGQVDDGDALVLPEDRESWAGARVLYIPKTANARERAAPDGVSPYRRTRLTARPELTAPDPWHPRIHAAFAPGTTTDGRSDHPVYAEEFLEALREFDGGTVHRLGGHAHAIQNPVEIEIAQAVLPDPVPWHDPRLHEEAADWTLLAQFDSEGAAGMMWGDTGTLYWLIRPADLTARRFDRAMFTWQCC